MEVVVQLKQKRISFESETLDVARLVASTFGWAVDLEPTGQGGAAKLTATNGRTGAIVRTNGSSVVDAAEKLIDLLANTERVIT